MRRLETGWNCMRCTMHSTTPKLPPETRSGLRTYLTTLTTQTLTCALSENDEIDLCLPSKSSKLKTQRSEVQLRFSLWFYGGKRVVRMECCYGYGRLAIKYQDSLTSVQKFRYAAQTGQVQVFLDFTQMASLGTCWIRLVAHLFINLRRWGACFIR